MRSAKSIYVQAADSLSYNSVAQFLAELKGPSAFYFQGRDPDRRCRIITTLLHANEPSGFNVLHKFIQDGFQPLADTYFVVASVAAAQLEPTFSHRILPGERDLNRCFRPPYQDFNGQLAKSIIDFIVSKHPELVIDMHNTSGNGPIFSVATRYQQEHLALGSFFSRWLVHTDIALGALMEVPFACPIITVEAGGAHEPQADFNAYNGLTSLLLSAQPFTQQQSIDVLHQPIRFRLSADSTLAYSDRPVFGVNVTLEQSIENANFGVVDENTRLGWTDLDGLDHFELHGCDTPIEQYFSAESGELRPRQPMKLFMATTQADIAKNDCIFYFVDTERHAHYKIASPPQQDHNALSESY
ncbi:succinylglutamate desuccinylase [Alteromonas flava]|uniref:succinylglutamate desuccinylase n=1 Tax=Alteromonas flava TaxID=2048003 RepID=UPI000C2852B5|nr:succinylglutamate desuccinylase [Alteromonas flava]